jgi:long-chain acyl-CoA synthetase
VRASRLVSHAVVVGEGRPFVGALVTLDLEEVGRWARSKGLPALTAEQAAVHPAVLAEVQEAVDAANATVSAAEGIRKFMVLGQDFTEASGHLTPSLKLKRMAVLETHAAQIERLYAR